MSRMDEREFMAELGARLREARGPLPQAQAGAAVGLSRTSWLNIEHGKQNITVAALARFAKALGVPMASLLPDSLEPLADIHASIPSGYTRLRDRVTELEAKIAILTANWPKPP